MGHYAAAGRPVVFPPWMHPKAVMLTGIKRNRWKRRRNEKIRGGACCAALFRKMRQVEQKARGLLNGQLGKVGP